MTLQGEEHRKIIERASKGPRCPLLHLIPSQRTPPFLISLDQSLITFFLLDSLPTVSWNHGNPSWKRGVRIRKAGAFPYGPDRKNNNWILGVSKNFSHALFQ